MQKYRICGGTPLSGTVTISGAKNAAVAILPATLLVKGVCHLENVPNISDVRLLLDILRGMGASVNHSSPNTVEIDCSAVENATAPIELVRRLRASYYLIGAELARFGKAKVALPGGCNFSDRPIDQHLKGFSAMGADIELTDGYVIADANGRLTGAHLFPDLVSVGATINTMIAATLAVGTTIIENAAKEPHVVDLANFLNSMGARISGAGTDTIKVRGVNALHGGTYAIIPDQIETGTYMALAAATGGDIMIRNVIPRHMESVTAKLREMGVNVTEYDDAIRVRGGKPMRSTKVKTLPYPGFPTDMQPLICVCMCLANGTSMITESIYDTRFGYTSELSRMGADIRVDGKIAVVTGGKALRGCTVRAFDLRAGAAMVVAALAAEGVSIVERVEYIERGYESMVQKLRDIGADIQVLDAPDGSSGNIAV